MSVTLRKPSTPPSSLTEGNDLIRVSGSEIRGQSTLIKGVPVRQTGVVKSASYSIWIWVKSAELPVEVAPGQVWSVEGSYEVLTIERGDFISQARCYRSPRSLGFDLPNDGETFVQFIARDPAFKGIGEVKARELWHAFGAELHSMLESDGDKYLEAFRAHLTDKSIKALFAGYQKYANLRHSLWMTEASIPASVQRRLLKYHGSQTTDTLKANPFELIHFGLSLSQVDQLLHKQKGWPQRTYPEQRVQAAAKLGLDRCLEDGSTYALERSVRTKLSNILKNTTDVDAALEYLRKHESAAIYHPVEKRFHPTALAIQELAVAKRLKALSERKRVFDVQDEAALNWALKLSPHKPTEQQLEAIKTLLVNDIACLTGGAGTGKTFTCNTFLRASVELGYDIFAVALSGRAAMRLHESIGFITSTIARFLRGDPVLCERGERKILLIDEASMIDLQTLFKLINHVSPYVKIVLVGDPNQLPPIGNGKILHDLVSGGVVTNALLDIVKRQRGSTGIPEYTASIKDGIVPQSLSSGRISFHETLDVAAIDSVIGLYEQSPTTTKIVASTRASVSELNVLIQERTNGHSPRLEFTRAGQHIYTDLRLNDDVLFTKNNIQLGFQNGTLGKLCSVTNEGEVLGQIRTDTGDLIEVTEDVLDSIELGYAITLHKAQGSQFERVIVLLQNNRITDRSWVYTAITRAESEAHIVGASELFTKVVTEDPTAFKRSTLLNQLIACVT